MIYDKKFFLKTCAILIGMLVFMKVSGGYGYLVILPFAFASFIMRKYEMTLFWLVITIAMLMGNHYLMPKNNIMLLGQRIMIMIFGILMVAQLASKVKSPCLKPYSLIYIYMVYMLIPSFSGWSALISVLKIILFLLVYTAYLGVTNEVAKSSKSSIQKLRSMMLAVAAFYIIGSVMLIPFPAIGQLTGLEYMDAVKRTGQAVSLFKGMTLHSQALGPIITTFAVFLLADWTLSVRKFSKLHAFLLALCPLLIIKSSSRTAMGGLILGVLCVAFCVAKERGIGARWRAKVKGAITLGIAVIAIAIVAIPSTRDAVVRFALKYNTEATASDLDMEKVISTRQGSVEYQMYNFRKSPVVGNGFQVSADMAGLKRQRFANLLSAPVEKGVWVTAVLEEGGVIGLCIFLMFVIPASLTLLMKRAYMTFSMLFTMLVLNMGEMTMFSLTSTGGLCWLFTLIAGAFDALRQRDDRMRQNFGGGIPFAVPYGYGVNSYRRNV